MSNKSGNKVLLGSGLLLALTSSLCCIVPVLALIGGAGGMMSAFSRAAPLRPYLVAASALALGFSFYRAYRPERKDDCGCEEMKSVLQSKAFLWVVAVVSVLLSTFPYYAGAFERKTVSPPVAATPNIRQAVIHIRGMGCADCEGIVNRVLLEIDELSREEAGVIAGDVVKPAMTAGVEGGHDGDFGEVPGKFEGGVGVRAV